MSVAPVTPGEDMTKIKALPGNSGRRTFQVLSPSACGWFSYSVFLLYFRQLRLRQICDYEILRAPFIAKLVKTQMTQFSWRCFEIISRVSSITARNPVSCLLSGLMFKYLNYYKHSLNIPWFNSPASIFIANTVELFEPRTLTPWHMDAHLHNMHVALKFTWRSFPVPFHFLPRLVQMHLFQLKHSNNCSFPNGPTNEITCTINSPLRRTLSRVPLKGNPFGKDDRSHGTRGEKNEDGNTAGGRNGERRRRTSPPQFREGIGIVWAPRAALNR